MLKLSAERIALELVELVESGRPVPEHLREGHFRLHSALLRDATTTSSVIKELLLHSARGQATDLMKAEFRDEEDEKDFELTDELNAYL